MQVDYSTKWNHGFSENRTLVVCDEINCHFLLKLYCLWNYNLSARWRGVSYCTRVVQ